MKKTIRFLITGVGGQGTILASDILAEVGLRLGHDAKKSDILGLAVRGGSVVSHIIWGENVRAPMIDRGTADYYLSFEWLEGLRRLVYTNKDTVVLANDWRIDPVSVSSGQADYPDEDGIRAAIGGNLDAIAAGTRPAIIYRPRYQPYRRHPKYTGFMALYVHYLYLLGKAGQRQYPPRMTPHLRREIMKFESYKEQFAFLRAHGITTAEDLSAVRARAEETLASLMKQRTILNVRKKKRRALYDALSDAEALAPARDCYESGMPGMEEQFAKYMDAVSTLEQCGIPREQLMAEKAELYRQLADVNREIRQARKEIAMCETIEKNRPQMEHDIQVAERRGRQQEMELPSR